MISTLVTDRLVLRPPSPGDLDGLVGLFGDLEVMRFVGNGKVFSSVQVAHMLETMLAEARHGSAHPSWVPGVPGALMVVDPGSQEFVGMAVLRMLAPDLALAIGGCPEPAVEAGYVLGRAFWGRGFATEIASAVVRHGVSLVGREHIIAVADVGNTVSHRVLGKVGFSVVKEFDYRDMRMNYWRLTPLG
ncbi:MAG: GNAT family N-acetyltransferase [Fimbriimonas sp.]